MNKEIELAEAQILGFYECYNGGSMKDLVESMGLEKEEWEIIKKEMSVLSYLSEELKKEIEDYFKLKKL